MSDLSPPSAPARRLPVHALRYGGIAGLIGGAWVPAAFGFGFYGGWVETMGIVVPISAVVLGVMRWRDQVTGGETRFASAFGAGLAIGLVYATVVAFGFFLFAQVRPEPVIEQWLEMQTARMQLAGIAPESIDEAVAAARPQLSPAFFAKQRFAFALIVSLIVSLIAAVVIPRRRI